MLMCRAALLRVDLYGKKEKCLIRCLDPSWILAPMSMFE
jgi:hypothetical protein